MSTAIQQDLPAAVWGLDTTHSTATFSLKYMVSTFRTRLRQVRRQARHDG